jgi:peptidoglycan/xylan/chitin deacetylase (PgdA/CDA1 family)
MLRSLRLAAADAVAAAIWKTKAHPSRLSGRVPVLCYHRVLPDWEDRSVPAYNVYPEALVLQLQFLRAEGFKTLTLDQYHMIAVGALPIPERAVLITFDDGFADTTIYAAPIAQAEGASINLFLCTGLPDGCGPRIYPRITLEMIQHSRRHPDLWRGLSWSDVRSLRHAGVTLGYHSHGHPNFGRISESEARADFEKGVASWLRNLGGRPSFFAFPYGGFGTCPPSAVTIAREYGALMVFTTRLGRTRLPCSATLFDRLMIYQTDDITTFRRKLFGAYDWVGHARGVMQALRCSTARG